MVDGVDGELGFDLKTFGEYGERFDERFAHGSIAGHDIIETVAVDPFDHGPHKVVSKSVEGSLVFLGIGAV